jgi:hypothetical protein
LDNVPKDHLTAVARRIRRKLVKQFAVIGISAVVRSGGVKFGQPGSESSEWRVGLDVVWKTGCVASPRGNSRELVTEDRDQHQEAAEVDSEAASPRGPACAAKALAMHMHLQMIESQTLMVQVAFCTAAVCSVVLLVRNFRDGRTG